LCKGSQGGGENSCWGKLGNSIRVLKGPGAKEGGGEKKGERGEGWELTGLGEK